MPSVVRLKLIDDGFERKTRMAHQARKVFAEEGIKKKGSRRNRQRHPIILLEASRRMSVRMIAEDEIPGSERLDVRDSGHDILIFRKICPREARVKRMRTPSKISFVFPCLVFACKPCKEDQKECKDEVNGAMHHRFRCAEGPA